MTSIAIVIGGVVVALVGVFIWLLATRQKKAKPVDTIESTTGSNRTLTGAQPAGAVASLDWDEALRKFVAYALDDVPREALSRPPDRDHTPVFKAVQQILERIEARPDPLADRGQAHGEVDGRGRLADATLAGSHGDDRPHAWHQRFLRRRLRVAVSLPRCPERRRRCRRAAAAGGALGGQHGRAGRHPWQLAHRSLAGFAQRLELRRLRRVDLDGKADIAAP